MLLQRCSPLTSFKRPSAAPTVAVRAVAEPSTKHANGNGAARKDKPFINVIEHTAWENGIPPVMVRACVPALLIRNRIRARGSRRGVSRGSGSVVATRRLGGRWRLRGGGGTPPHHRRPALGRIDRLAAAAV